MRRSTIFTHVPPRIRKQLEKRLIANDFSSYLQLTQWLQGQGCQVSSRAVYRYGRKFEERHRLLELARGQMRELLDASPDDELACNSAVLFLIQQEVLAFLSESPRPFDQKHLTRLAGIVSKLARTTISHLRFVTQRPRPEASASPATPPSRRGLSADAEAAIRRLLSTIAGDRPPRPPSTTDD